MLHYLLGLGSGVIISLLIFLIYVFVIIDEVTKDNYDD